jgi:hypothetical protein
MNVIFILISGPVPEDCRGDDPSKYPGMHAAGQSRQIFSAGCEQFPPFFPGESGSDMKPGKELAAVHFAFLPYLREKPLSLGYRRNRQSQPLVDISAFAHEVALSDSVKRQRLGYSGHLE